jgi:hypothetical protein
MKTEKAIQLVMDILKEHNVNDWGVFKRYGYKVSELDVFCVAAATILKKFPESEWNHGEIARNARNMHSHADDYISGKDYISIPIMNNLCFFWNNYNKNCFRPSIIKDSVLSKRTAVCHKEVSSRIAEVREYVENIFSSVPKFHPEKTQISNPWHNVTMLKFFLEDGYNFSMIVNHHDLVHDCIEKLCGHAKTYFEKYTKALIEYDTLDHALINKEIEKINQKYNLHKYPFSLKYNASANLFPSYGNKSISFYIHGYTESGIFEDIDCASLYQASLGMMESNCRRALARQVARHKKFGSPKKSWSEINIDRVTLDYLKTLPEGIEVLEEFMRTGINSLARTGVRLRHTRMGVLGSFKMGNRIEWKGDKICVLNAQLSQVVLSALKGRNITTLLEHEIISNHATIKSGQLKTRKNGTRVEVSLKPEMAEYRLGNA